MKFVSETNTYEGGVRRATIVREYTEEEDRRGLAQVAAQIAYKMEQMKKEGDPERHRVIAEQISNLKREEKRLIAAIAGYDA